MNVFAIVIGFQAIMTFGGIWPGPSVPAAAESFGGLAELVELGEDVTVSYEPDGEVPGRALDVSEASLTLMVDASPFELDQVSILRVRQRWQDPTWDGTLKGFGLGFSPMMVVSILSWMDDGSPGAASVTGQMMITTAFGVIGALIGTAVDSSRTELIDLYVKPQKPRVSLSPTVSKDRLGAGLTISW